jgi:hypothetical protein
MFNFNANYIHLTKTKMKVFVLLIIIFVRKSQSGWDRIWNEEFDDKIIDTNKWQIVTYCDG